MEGVGPRSAGHLSKDPAVLVVKLASLRAPPPARTGLDQSLAGSADPTDPPRRDTREKREVGHITGHDSSSRNERPSANHASRKDHGPRAQRRTLAHDDPAGVPVPAPLYLAAHIYRAWMRVVRKYRR